MNVLSLRRASTGIFGSDFSDPTNERLIYLSALGLAIIGLALLVGTIMWWRRGRQEHPALAPLEVMSGRAWAKAPEGDRRRRLDHVRLAGSAAAANASARSEPVDLEALVRSTPQAFDDLREPEGAGAGPPPDEVADADHEASQVQVVADAEPESVAEAKPADAPKPLEPPKPAAVAEPVKPAVVTALPPPAGTSNDATSVSAERPQDAVEALASGSTDQSS